MSNNVQNDNRPSFFPNSKTARAKQVAKKQYQRLSESESQKNNSPEQSNLSASVEISEGLKDYSRIKEIAVNAPEQDNSEKIEMLKNQINSGSYQVDYDRLAEQLLFQELS